jgi:hypothetical protein
MKMVDYSLVIISRLWNGRKDMCISSGMLTVAEPAGVVWYGMTRPRHASGLPKRSTETEARADVSYILDS